MMVNLGGGCPTEDAPPSLAQSHHRRIPHDVVHSLPHDVVYSILLPPRVRHLPPFHHACATTSHDDPPPLVLVRIHLLPQWKLAVYDEGP